MVKDEKKSSQSTFFRKVGSFFLTALFELCSLIVFLFSCLLVLVLFGVNLVFWSWVLGIDPEIPPSLAQYLALILLSLIATFIETAVLKVLLVLFIAVFVVVIFWIVAQFEKLSTCFRNK